MGRAGNGWRDAPRPPALADARGRFIQLTLELAALSNLVGTELIAMSLPDVRAAVASLARDERNAAQDPAPQRARRDFNRAGLGPLLAELRARRLDPDPGRRDPAYLLVSLDHRADRIR